MERKKILLIDDTKFFHETGKAVLEDTYDVACVYSAAEGFDYLSRVKPDLILLDIVMPVMDGYEMLRLLKKNAKLKDIPVIFLTASTNPETEVEGFNCGIVDYITKPFVPIVMKKRVETQIALAEYERDLQAKVDAKVKEIEEMYDLITVSFAGLVEQRDGVTGGHLKNTAIYYSEFMEHLLTVPKYREQLPEDVVKKACRSAPLHDVGKIAIEDAVLRKEERLEEGEFEQMKMHAIIGGEIFAFLKERIPDSEFAAVAEQVARFHHEKWNGKGYPDGLKGTEIPLVARIMSIVDVYDALTSQRPYKPPYSHETALQMIVDKSGMDFDPELVDEFVEISDTIRECLQRKQQILQDQQYFMLDKNDLRIHGIVKD